MKKLRADETFIRINNDPQAEKIGLNQLFRDFLQLTQKKGFAKAGAAWANGTIPGRQINPTSAITIIPTQAEVCTPLVLVLIASWRGHKARFGGSLEPGDELAALNTQLVLCEKVRGVLIISETWDSRQWSEHWGKLCEAWSRRGIVFGFAVSSAKGKTLIPIPLDE